MKINEVDYIELKGLVDNFISNNSDFIPIMKQNNHSKTRIAFDIFHKASFNTRLNPFKPSLTNRLYQYLNDNNIESALNNILKGRV